MYLILQSFTMNTRGPRLQNQTIRVQFSSNLIREKPWNIVKRILDWFCCEKMEWMHISVVT